MSKNKKIELQPGYLVNDWTCEIEEIHYTKVPINNWGNPDENYLILNSKWQYSLETIYSTKIVDTLEEALVLQKEFRQKKIKYYSEEIEKYQKRLEELQNSKE